MHERLGLVYRLSRKYRHLKNRNKPPLKVWWWRSNDSKLGLNFGDEISPYIIKGVFGRNVIRASETDCELIAAGSILQIFQGLRTHRIKVWGSGFIKEGKKNSNSNLEFYAVRGPLTRMRVGNEDVTLGDPGILASLVFSASSRRTHKVGIVPHYVDVQHEILDKIRANPDYKIINPLQHPEKVAAEITSCDLILSSSLHGIIFADSFGIPAYWMPLSDGVVGGEYKFKDYYLSTGREIQKADASVIGNAPKLRELRENAQKIAHLRRMQSSLIRAFPYK